MIKLTQYDKLFSMSEILENIKLDLELHQITDEANISHVASVLSVALNESGEFIAGAIRPR